MNLPEEMLIEILVRMPVKSILRFKCVCKYWIFVIQSLHFVKRHLQFSGTRSSKLLCFYTNEHTRRHVVSVLDNHTLKKLQDLEWPPFLEEEDIKDPVDFYRRISVFGPVNGIYCIHRRLFGKISTLTLWNPTTRDYKHILPHLSFPTPLHLKRPKDTLLMIPSLRIGFGFDSTTNDYKVVVICHCEILYEDEYPAWQLKSYNHASGTWKDVYFVNCAENAHPIFEGANPPFPLIHRDSPISHCLLNGVFHWACSVYYAHCCYSILAFEMTTDAMRLMKGPPFSTKPSEFSWGVWVLNENIAAISYAEDPSKNVEVWMMMEYGVENSWAKLYSFRNAASLVPVGIPCDDVIFFGNKRGTLLVRLDLVYGVLRDYSRYGCESLGILNYVESLASLQ